MRSNVCTYPWFKNVYERTAINANMVDPQCATLALSLQRSSACTVYTGVQQKTAIEPGSRQLHFFVAQTMPTVLQ